MTQVTKVKFIITLITIYNCIFVSFFTVDFAAKSLARWETRGENEQGDRRAFGPKYEPAPWVYHTLELEVVRNPKSRIWRKLSPWARSSLARDFHVRLYLGKQERERAFDIFPITWQKPVLQLDDEPRINNVSEVRHNRFRLLIAKHHPDNITLNMQWDAKSAGCHGHKYRVTRKENNIL